MEPEQRTRNTQKAIEPTKPVFMPQDLQEPDKPGPPERNNSGPRSANKIF